MSKIIRKLDKLMESFLIEEDPMGDNMDAEEGLIKIFYSDLDMDGKQKVLQAISDSFDYIDVFSDDVVRENIEEALGRRPMITLSGEELVNKMDIEL